MKDSYYYRQVLCALSSALGYDLPGLVAKELKRTDHWFTQWVASRIGGSEVDSKPADQAAFLVQKEMHRQDDLWGKQCHLEDCKWLHILMEELGEFSEAVLQGQREHATVELIQSAAVTRQWILDLETRG